MHKCLQLDALDKLPVSIQQLALTVLDGGSFDTGNLNLLFERTPRENWILLLPVIYEILDPAPISTGNSGVSPSWKTMACVVPLFAMEGIPQISDMPKEVGLDLWPRLWAWFLFIESDCQHRDDRDSEWVACTRIIRCAHHFRYLHHIDTNTLLQNTPGLFSAVTRAWQSALQLHGGDGTPEAPTSMEAVSQLAVALLFLSTDPKPWNITSPRMLQDLVEGAEGSPAVFASVLIQHIHIALGLLTATTEVLRGTGGIQLPQLVIFIDSLHDPADRLHAELPRQILRELVEQQDLIPSLFHVVHTVAAIPVTQDSDNVASGSLQLLTRLLVGREICGAAARASIIAGLLRSAVLCAQKSYLPKSHVLFKSALLNILPLFTLHRRALRCIRGALTKAEPYAIKRRFATAGFLSAWTHFAGVAKERLAVLDAFESGETLHMKSCDNISCNKLAAKTDFMRCSACKKSYYCSRDCQATDWNDGGHREACEESTETLLCDERMSSTTREQSFIRMVLHRDYLKAKKQIFRDTIKCQREHPGAGYFVEFNYVTTPVEINVHSLSTDSKTNEISTLFRRGGHPSSLQLLSDKERSRKARHVHLDATDGFPEATNVPNEMVAFFWGMCGEH
ncbi:hypothetical protein FB45DRAFT_523865 [Roridomyces roridus]|uniref:MYND-type domain-containing protein n=1 Tax=Roridomyces roridus TaxID=1738132 RepID=A0AAD7FMZ5_9AGAR|nr:hypothetical protein FB45DRAFT_523865 [Roridomyces roridus]